MDLQTFIDIDAFSEEVKQEIDSNNLSAALSTQTARHAYYSIQAVSAQRQRDEVARNCKLIAAQLTKTVRAKLVDEAAKAAEDAGGKRAPERVTNDAVQAEVTLHPEMRRWEKLLIEAEEIYAIAKVAKDAFFTRKEMLKQVGNITVESMRKDMKFQSNAASMEEYQARRAARTGGGAAQGQ